MRLRVKGSARRVTVYGNSGEPILVKCMQYEPEKVRKDDGTEKWRVTVAGATETVCEWACIDARAEGEAVISKQRKRNLTDIRNLVRRAGSSASSLLLASFIPWKSTKAPAAAAMHYIL